MYYEDLKKGLDLETLLSIANGNQWLSLRKLVRQTPALIRGHDNKKRFYVVGHTFVTYLITKCGGIEKWVKYNEELKSCDSRDNCFDDKLRSVYGKNLEGFQAEFNQYIAEALVDKFGGDRRVQVAVYFLLGKSK